MRGWRWGWRLEVVGETDCFRKFSYKQQTKHKKKSKKKKKKIKKKILTKNKQKKGKKKKNGENIGLKLPGLTLFEVFETRAGFEVFAQYLVKELAVENILFLVEIKQFKAFVRNLFSYFF